MVLLLVLVHPSAVTSRHLLPGQRQPTTMAKEVRPLFFITYLQLQATPPSRKRETVECEMGGFGPGIRDMPSIFIFFIAYIQLQATHRSKARRRGFVAPNGQQPTHTRSPSLRFQTGGAPVLNGG